MMQLMDRIESQLAPLLPKGMRKAVKERAEFAFWMAGGDGECPGNGHYRHFYTEFFGLSPEDYRDKSIIDIGCGPLGSLEWADGAHERIGLDALAHKYRSLGIERHQMRYVDAPAESIPFPARHFDFVTCFNALDHVDDLVGVLAEISRVLKKDGTFLLIVATNHKRTVTEPVSIAEPELKSLLEIGFDIKSWRTWPVPDDIHDPYEVLRGDAAPAVDGERTIAAARMTSRPL
jgi:SAM-dependent methyltransferase